MDKIAQSRINIFADYSYKLQTALADYDWHPVRQLADALYRCWSDGRHLYLCGNGGSASNAEHLANDFLYGIAKPDGMGIRVMALSANTSLLTCLANDLSYTQVFSQQLKVMARTGDILIVLSGSGNSPNIIETLHAARKIGVQTFAILGFDGGQCKQLADVPIHFPVDDMQIAEDLQLIVGHMLTKELMQRRMNS
jgi:D-sedoheptulose 7-phosphate isomerase